MKIIPLPVKLIVENHMRLAIFFSENLVAKIRKRLISNKNLEKSLFFRALLH